MSMQFKKLLEDMAEQLGYTEMNRLGSGHLEAVHPNGAKVRLPLTPRNEWREKRNARSALERAAGKKLPRDNAGKKGRKAQKKRKGFTDTKPSTLSTRSQVVGEMIAWVEDIDRRIREAVVENTKASYDEAKRLLNTRSAAEDMAAEKGVIIAEFRL